MYISSFQIENYKSFYKPDPIKFNDGMNIIVGANNSGKTALLEALSLNIESNPHSSPITVPKPYGKRTATHTIRFTLTLSRADLKTVLSDYGEQISMPYVFGTANEDKQLEIAKAHNRGQSHPQQPDQNEIFNEWLSQPGFIDILFEIRKNKLESNSKCVLYDHYLKTQPTANHHLTVYGQLQGNGKPSLGITSQRDQKELVKLDEPFRRYLYDYYQSHLYRFLPERMKVDKCHISDSKQLLPDASNLAAVLDNLQANPKTYADFNAQVRTIFPDIKWVSVEKISNEMVEIRIWPFEDKQHLAVPLSQAGTGIGQILAILYITLTMDSAFLIIDEPQTFLHPAAIRRIMDFLNDTDHHQYFISTHSTAIIAAAKSPSITTLRYIDGESQINELDSHNIDDLRELLDELGVQYSDVFGPDHVLWVEGPTEVKCFPLILKHFTDYNLRSIRILPLETLGDKPNKKLAKTIFRLQQKLSSGNMLFTSKAHFTMDLEARNEIEQTDLREASEGLLQFLDWRMYENYLLNEPGIAAVLNTVCKDAPDFTPLTPMDIEKKISEEIDINTNKYFDLPFINKKGTPEWDSDWKHHVRGDKLLEKLFNDLSTCNLKFEKTTHSVELTKWILENDPEKLRDVGKFLKDVFES